MAQPGEAGVTQLKILSTAAVWPCEWTGLATSSVVMMARPATATRLRRFGRSPGEMLSVRVVMMAWTPWRPAEFLRRPEHSVRYR